MRTLLCFLTLLAATIHTAHADEHPLNGTWKGSGFIETATGSQKSLFELTIEQTDTSLTLRECLYQPDDQAHRACQDSKYEVKETFQIWNETRRIGESYTWSIHIFEGQPMVSEQMVIEMNPDHTLSFLYNYGNYDGESMMRKATLTK